MSRPRHQLLGRILRVVVTLLFLGFLLTQVDFDALGRTFAAARWPGVAAAGLIAALAYPLLGLRFHGLLRATGLPVTHGAAQALTWIGQFFNSFLPGATGGDIARLYYLWKDSEGRRAAAVIALVADRLVGMVVLMAAGTAAFLAIDPVVLLDPDLSGLASRMNTGAVLASAAGIAVAIVSMGLLRSLHRLEPSGKLGGWIDALFGRDTATSIRDSGRLFRGYTATVALAIALTVVAWLVEFTAGWIVARSLGIGIGWTTMAAGMALAYAAAAIPVSLGGHGVREATLVFALSAAAGTDPSQPGIGESLVGLALVLLAINVACSAAGGIVHLFWNRATIPHSRNGGPTVTSRS